MRSDSAGVEGDACPDAVRTRKMLKAHNTLVLSNEAFDRFLTALDEPAQAVPELFEHHAPFAE